MKGAFYTAFKELTATVEGQTIPIKIEINVLFDEEPDLSWVDDESYARKIERGFITPSIIIVEARALGLVGIDSLGGVMVENTNDISDAVTDHAMIEGALDDLKKAVQNQIIAFKKAGLS